MIGNDITFDIIPANTMKIDTLYIHSNISPIYDDDKCSISTFNISDGNIYKIIEFIVK